MTDHYRNRSIKRHVLSYIVATALSAPVMAASVQLLEPLAGTARELVPQRTLTPAAATALREDLLREGDTIRVASLTPVEAELQITRINRRGALRRTLAARSMTDPSMRILLAVNDGVVLGEVWTNEAAYSLRPALGDAAHMTIVETPWSEFTPCGGAVMPVVDAATPAVRSTGEASSQFGCAESGALIDVLMVFTTAATAANGGASGIVAFADLAEEATNDAYANSNIATRVRIVDAATVSYVETGDSSIDLDRLQYNGDGFLDEAHVMREAIGADLVSMISSVYNDACGRGYIAITTTHEFPSYGFNVVADGCAIGNLSFAHEIGHNQGCRHNRESSASAGAYDYSHGYLAPGSAFRTVMAVSGGGPRVPHFSNPDVNYGGQPTGVPTSQSNSAHNALSIDNTSDNVAQFRCYIGAEPCPWDCAPSGGNGIINVDDLLEVTANFGGTGSCDASPDNGDGTFGNGLVNVDDVVAVISAFGPCP